MIKKQNITPQEVSWVKSNSVRLSQNASIGNLYYPETIDELVEIIANIKREGKSFDIIGYASNTLFLPSYHIDNLICTKKLKSYYETDEIIVCDCGVSVSSLSKHMVKKGYVGFEGLTDLPGTIAAAVYGNCGCRGCSVNDILHHIVFLSEDGMVVCLTPDDLKLKYRSSDIKRGERKGIILSVYLSYTDIGRHI